MNFLVSQYASLPSWKNLQCPLILVFLIFNWIPERELGLLDRINSFHLTTFLLNHQLGIDYIVAIDIAKSY